MELLVKPFRRSLQSHFDAVVYFFSKMDVEMISDLLDDKLQYLDHHKYMFVQRLEDLFDYLSQSGDIQLLALVDDDPLPINGSFGVTFEGDKTAFYLEVVFEVDSKGFITDIYEIDDCHEEISEYSDRERIFINQFSNGYEQKDLTFGDDVDEDFWL